jgi:hypothetical protein
LPNGPQTPTTNYTTSCAAEVEDLTQQPAIRIDYQLTPSCA